MNKTVFVEPVVRNAAGRRDIILAYFSLVKDGRFKEGAHFFTPDCKTHNPFTRGSMAALSDA
jgi:hypothetical protein